VPGWAGSVYEHTLGEAHLRERTRRRPVSTIPIKGPNDHTIAQIKDDAVRTACGVDDLRERRKPKRGGAFEVAAAAHLTVTKKTVQGRCVTSSSSACQHLHDLIT
jgi:hypothetical protein